MYTKQISFGKASVESLLTNHVLLNPLMDPLLSRLNIANEENNSHLLIAIIFLRYCPKLLNYKFQGGRQIDEKTLTVAKRIIELYPFKLNENTKLTQNKEITKKENFTPNEKNVNFGDQYNLIKQTFLSNEFKDLFYMYFSKEIYTKLYQEENKLKPNNPLSDINTAISILKIIQDVEYSYLNNNKTMYKWIDNLKNFSLSPLKKSEKKENFIEKYNIARLDLKNSGKENNNIEIIDISDEAAKISKPDWFKDNKGKGMQIETHENNLKLKLKIIQDGTLFIYLKGKYKTDKNNNILPIHVVYKSLTLNSIEQLNNNKLATCSSPITIKTNVKNNEMVEININWELLKEDKLDYSEKLEADFLKYNQIIYSKNNKN